MEEILVIGIGNNGRADDGLGWKFLDKISEKHNFELIYRYQLQVEDSELISNYEQVWFVDASEETHKGGYKYNRVEPEGLYSFTSHELKAETILFLCQDLYQKFPEAHLLAITGYDWELGHAITEQAQKGLDQALLFFNEKTESRNYEPHEN